MKHAAALLALAVAGCASGFRAVAAGDVAWESPPGDADGMSSHLQWGDPAKGPCQLLVKFLAGTTVPPHYHASDEVATVVTGAVVFGEGQAVDDAKGVEVSAGGYVVIPAGTAHWAKTRGEAVLCRFSPGPREMRLCSPERPAPKASGLKAVRAPEVPWTDSPGMAKGVKTVPQYGDPEKGPYLILLKFPNAMVHPPHYHGADEIVTILTGSIATGEGKVVDPAGEKPVSPGGYFVIPARTPHWGRPLSEITLTRLGNGPRDIFYFDRK